MRSLVWSVIVVCLFGARAVHAQVASGPAIGIERPAPVEIPYRVTLGGITFDPVDGVPTLPIEWTPEPHDGHDLYLIQLEGPTREVWLDAIQGADVEIVQYIHPYCYIVWSDQVRADIVGMFPFVRASLPFAPAFRVPDTNVTPVDEVVEVRVLMCRNAAVDAVVDMICATGAVCTSQAAISDCLEQGRFTARGDRMAEIARIPGVYAIKAQPFDGGNRGEMSNQHIAGNVDQFGSIVPGYASWLTLNGVDGSNVIIASVDSGMDDSHPDLVDRVLPCAGDTCGAAVFSGHGTHTAGIIVSSGASGSTANGGFLRGQGVAPGAFLIEQLYNPTFTQAGGMRKIIRESAQNGAIISANSWGPSSSPLGYEDDTLQVDLAVRDADPTTPGNQPMIYVLSIFNGDGGTSTQGTPDDAKNLIAVGSTSMQTFSSGGVDPQLDSISENSAHGPALDGRIVPHLVAPGCYVDSTTPSGLHALQCGTSMASPHVTGAIALFIDLYRQRFPDATDPSPALVKAAVLASCTSLAGYADADGNTLGHPVDSKQGWGRLDLAALLASPEGTSLLIDDPIMFDDSGESWTIDVSTVDPADDVRIMLVWTDAPGHGLGGATPAWNNDLDLVVEHNGATYRGNAFDVDGFSIADGTTDVMNNTEGVRLPAGTTGTITVRVDATNINSDGVPGTGDLNDQDFAIVVMNAVDGAAGVPCHADCAPLGPGGSIGNGLVNIDDLIAVINAFGSSEARCDIAPTNVDGTVGNGLVNIDDVIAVINAFGACP
ncbi:MAG: S8 family serine peptidase [Planctomycetota bacterium]